MTAKTIIVPVSGGKDSQVVLSMAVDRVRITGEKIVCVHQNTGYDHPDTYTHMKAMEAFYGVSIDFTVSVHGDMFGFLKKAQYFPNSAARGCTSELKQKPFAAWLMEHGFNKDNAVIWFGMRAEESADRNRKYGGNGGRVDCTLQDVSAFYGEKKYGGIGEIECHLPIVDWTTAEVFAHLAEENAPVNPLYARGHTRVGCYPCLLTRKAEWKLAANDPYGRKHMANLVGIEEHWARTNHTHKLIRIHKSWPIADFLKEGDATQDLPEDGPDKECWWCSI